MRNKIIFAIGVGLGLVGLIFALREEQAQPQFSASAPYYRTELSLVPDADSTRTLGTTSRAWLNLFVDEICLNGDCQSSWSAGTADGSFSTTSADYWKDQRNFFSTTSAQYFESIQWRWATTSSDYWLTQRQGAAFSTTSANWWATDAGYLTTVDISDNTNLTAGDALTLTGDDIDFDGGATPGGDLGNTWADPQVDNDSHDHTASTISGLGTADISGLDISDDTNLAATWPILLTGDTLSYDGLATTSPWTVGQVAYVNAGNRLTSVATGTVSAGSSAITVTAGRSVIGGALSIDCATATGSQNGCLSSTDWTTFNNKQAALTFTTPLHLTGTTVTFSGLATTSQPTSSQLLVSNGRAGVYGVSTSTLTATSPLTGSFVVVGSGGSVGCQSASASQAGCVTSTDYQRLYTATTTFAYPLVYTGSSNSVSLVWGTTTANTWSSLQTITAASTTYLTATNFWASMASTTNLFVSSAKNGVLVTNEAGAVSASSTLGLNRIPTCAQITGGSALCDGTDDGGGAAWPWGALQITYGTSTNATTTPTWFKTAFYASSTPSTPSVIDNLTVSNWATTTNLFVGTPSATGDSVVQVGSVGHEWTFGYNSSNFEWQLSSSTSIGTLNAIRFTKDLLAIFGNASSTNLSASQSLFVNSKRVTGTRYPVVKRATSTTWTGTTTLDQMIMRFSGTIDDVRCNTTSGFLRTQVYVNSTAVPPMFHASTTGGKVTFTANNSFADGDKLIFNFGTSSASITQIDCSGTISVTSD